MQTEHPLPGSGREPASSHADNLSCTDTARARHPSVGNNGRCHQAISGVIMAI